MRSILLLVLLVANSFAASSVAGELQAGRYVRVTKSPAFLSGGRETGELIVRASRQGKSSFALVATMNPVASDDGAGTHNGVVEHGVLRQRSKAWVYEERDEELGVCRLALRALASEALDVRQSGRCWWFGEGVDASGIYRRAQGKDIYVVQ